MPVPVSYVARNLWTRRLTSALTAGGLALVTFVFATVLMLDAGLKQTLVSTGEENNVVVIRKGSETEIQSAVTRLQAGVVDAHPAIALGADRRPLASRESVVLISLRKFGNPRATNVSVRGVSPAAYALRPQVRIAEGRAFRPGSAEVVVGAAIARSFEGAQLGSTLRFGQRDWTVVGILDGGGSGFDSEVWGDVEQFLQAFRRQAFSSMVFRMNDPSAFDALRVELDADPRLTLQFKRERQFYEDQSKALSTFINVLGLTLSAIFSIGAMIGATITMYASVASRTAEIGTLRALGFRRRSVLGAFLLEAVLLGFAGGALGLGLASFMQFGSFSTTNFQTFADLTFTFTLTPAIAAKTLGFSIGMGLLGGFLPSMKASRLEIVVALRSA